MTGQRGTTPVSPRDITGRRSRELLREKAQREKAADIDVETIRREAFQRGYEAAWEPAYLAGWNALAGILTDAGVNVDDVLALSDEPADDDEPEDGE